MRYLFLLFLNVFITAPLFAQGLSNQNIQFANSSLGFLSDTRQNDVVLSFNTDQKTETYTKIGKFQDTYLGKKIK